MAEYETWLSVLENGLRASGNHGVYDKQPVHNGESAMLAGWWATELRRSQRRSFAGQCGAISLRPFRLKSLRR
jgi:hypothetical protein